MAANHRLSFLVAAGPALAVSLQVGCTQPASTPDAGGGPASGYDASAAPDAGSAAGDAASSDAPGLSDVSVSASIGPEGGTVGSAVLGAWLTIPPGALSAPVTFTISQVATPFPGIVGPNFDIAPDGTQFAVPATISLAYTPAELDGAAPTDFSVAFANLEAGAWSPFSPPIVDVDAQTIGATTSTLIDLGLAEAKPFTSNCANGAACKCDDCVDYGPAPPSICGPMYMNNQVGQDHTYTDPHLVDCNPSSNPCGQCTFFSVGEGIAYCCYLSG